MNTGAAICLLLLCACGDNDLQRNDAGTDASDARSDDAAADVIAPMTGIAIGGVALGVRRSVVLTLTTGPDTQNAIVDEDGPFQFPGLVPPGSNYLVSTADTTCDVIGASGTNVSTTVTSVQLFCAGVVELASVAFASGSPAVAFPSVLTPTFDRGATTYSGTRPYFMDDTDVVSVTPFAAYPTLPSISVYADITTSGQPSPAHVLGANIPVRLQHPTTLARTYSFTLVPAKPTQTALLEASVPAALDHFGTVGLSGDVLVVGAQNHAGTGAAYVLRRGVTGWTQEQVIQPTADAGAQAGAAVAIDGDVLVVGAPYDVADDSGRAYVYRRNAASNTWVLDAGGTLAATTPQAAEVCGASVAISGTRIIIGCPGEKGSGNKSSVGAVYMFRFDATSSAWVADGTIKGGYTGDVFGSSVALSGTTAVVGAPQEANGTALAAGGVHVLVRGASSWSQQGTTLRGDVVASSRFGAAVAISVDRILAGAPGAGNGAAYMFQRSGGAWSQDGPTLVPTLPVPVFAEFGDAVAIDGTHAVIGAPSEDSTVSNSGAVHAYRRDSTGWTTNEVVNASNPSSSKFGASVALDGEWIAVGAPEESSVASIAGAVYVFR